MKLRTLWLGIVLGASVLLASTARADSILSTTGSWDSLSGIQPFGEPNTATYGQTFTAPGGNLNSFTFYVNDALNPDFTDFQVYVMAWDDVGRMATGPVLFQSGLLSTTNNGGLDGFEVFTINTGGLALSTGNSYVAFFSASQAFDGSEGTSDVAWIESDVYAGGNFVFYNNGNNFGLLTSSAWDNFLIVDGDLAFQMSFGDTNAVPEPATLALFAFGAAGLARKRLRRKSAD